MINTKQNKVYLYFIFALIESEFDCFLTLLVSIKDCKHVLVILESSKILQYDRLVVSIYLQISKQDLGFYVLQQEEL